MSTKQSVRYDFGRCTVEHLGGTSYGTGFLTDEAIERMRRHPEVITIRVAQSPEHKNDEAMFTLVDYDARMLATAILEALDAT